MSILEVPFLLIIFVFNQLFFLWLLCSEAVYLHSRSLSCFCNSYKSLLILRFHLIQPHSVFCFLLIGYLLHFHQFVLTLSIFKFLQIFVFTNLRILTPTKHLLKTIQRLHITKHTFRITKRVLSYLLSKFSPLSSPLSSPLPLVLSFFPFVFLLPLSFLQLFIH